jgi:hypothetical protein
VSAKRGPLSLVSTNGGLLGRKTSASVLENREYGRTNPPRSPHDILYPQKLTLTSQTRGGLSVGIVRSQIKVKEIFLLLLLLLLSCVGLVFTNPVSYSKYPAFESRRGSRPFYLGLISFSPDKITTLGHVKLRH